MTAPSQQVTRSALREGLAALFGDASDCDVALLYFAGHGTENDLGGYLVTQDIQKYDEGIALTEVLTLANQSQARERIIILDSCHAGHVGEVPASGSSVSTLQEGVSILTAARSSQSAAEVNGGGVFTELLCGALQGGAADVLGQTTVAAVYAYIEQVLTSWEQRPMFRANVAKLISVRNNQATIQPEMLRTFPQLFSQVDSVFPLDPSYEPTEHPNHPDHEALFEKLQKCRAAKLVEPVGEDHMYYAALHSTGCQLTPLGVHYWRLAKAKQV